MIGFFGHTNTTGKVNQTCFSNFYPAQFVYKGYNFPTSEHALMASKAMVFWDTVRFQMIVKSDTPSSAKQYGRKVEGYTDSIWAACRYQIMTDILIEKFTQNDLMCEYLLSTGEEILVETSPYDKVWGIGMGQENRAWVDQKLWKGQNLLGFALMDTRRALQGRNS